MRNTKAYKIELLVIDHEGMGEDSIAVELENCRYIYPTIMEITEANIGEWDDDHPLNKYSTMKAEYERLFGGK